MELTKILHYKLRMICIPIYGPTLLFCDNKSVVISTSVLTSTFSKELFGYLLPCSKRSGFSVHSSDFAYRWIVQPHGCNHQDLGGSS